MEHVTTPERPGGTQAEPGCARRRVLVSLGAGAHPSTEVGRIVARAISAQLHGVLVWPTAITPCDVPRLLRLDPQALEGMVIDVDVGDPAERLSALSRVQPVAFLILPTENGGDEAGVGEVTKRTLALVAASVIVVRPRASLTRIRHILVPLDGTPSAAAALAPASELAQRAGAALDLLLVQDATRPPPAEPGTMAPRYVDQPQHDWPAFSAEFIDRFLGSIGREISGIPVRFFLGAGCPGKEVLRYAGELASDLIALTWQPGSEREPRAVLWQVMAGATQPVLVVRR